MTDRATVGGAPRDGMNCRLTINDYGVRYVRVETLAYGVKIASSESQARDTKAYYPLNVGEPEFMTTMVWLSAQEREEFNTWLQVWMEKVSRNENVGGFVTVEIPVRNFLRKGIPSTSLVYGDKIGMIKFSAQLTFVGTVNPIDGVGVGNSRAIDLGDSYYVGPVVGGFDNTYFNPSGVQLSGRPGGMEDALYNGKGTLATKTDAEKAGLDETGRTQAADAQRTKDLGSQIAKDNPAAPGSARNIPV